MSILCTMCASLNYSRSYVCSLTCIVFGYHSLTYALSSLLLRLLLLSTLFELCFNIQHVHSVPILGLRACSQDCALRTANPAPVEDRWCPLNETYWLTFWRMPRYLHVKDLSCRFQKHVGALLPLKITKCFIPILLSILQRWTSNVTHCSCSNPTFASVHFGGTSILFLLELRIFYLRRVRKVWRYQRE